MQELQCKISDGGMCWPLLKSSEIAQMYCPFCASCLGIVVADVEVKYMAVIEFRAACYIALQTHSKFAPLRVK